MILISSLNSKKNNMKKVKCLLRLHGSSREIHLNFDSISEAKKWAKNSWNKPYTIVIIKYK